MMPSRFYIPEDSQHPPISIQQLPHSPNRLVSRKQSAKKKSPPSNSPSLLLTAEENELVYRILGNGRQTLSTAVVEFLVPAEDFRKWKLQEVGVLCFVRDAGVKSYFLEVLSLRMNRVIFSQEIYDEFGYRKPRSRFLTFEGDNFTIGMSFASEEEIISFQVVLDDKMAAKRERIAARQSRIFELQHPAGSSVTNTPPPVRHQSPVPPSPNPSINNRRITSFDNKLDFGMPNQISNLPSHPAPPQKQTPVQQAFGFKNTQGRHRKLNKKKEKKKPLEKRDIGLPTDFRKVLHAGFDPERGFVVDNFMDDKFSQLFHMAGVTDKDMEEHHDLIVNVIANYDGDINAGGKKLANSANAATLNRPTVQPQTSRTNPPTNAKPPPAVPARLAAPGKTPHPRRGSVKPTNGKLPSPTFQNTITVRPIPSPAPMTVLEKNVNIPAPPPPPPSTTTPSGMAPPPPPMPIQQLQPPGGSSTTDSREAAKKPPPLEDDRSALLRQIEQGKKLKRIEVVDPSRKGKSNGDAHLKSAGLNDTMSSPNSMQGLAGALARALAERKGAVNPDTDSGSDEDEEVFDEDEWE